MFDSYYYAIQQKMLLAKSMWAKLRQIEELNALSAWAKKKKLTKVEQRYRTLLVQTEDNLFWQAREHKVLLELCRWGLELYHQLVPTPKFYQSGSAAKYRCGAPNYSVRRAS